MRVAIAGGHGQIAMRLSRLLADGGDEPVALIRNPDHADEVRATGAEPLECNLETADAEEVAEAIRAAGAVVFAAGAGPGSGPERKWTVDYGGAVKLIEAARDAGIRRYVMVSAYRADPDHPGHDTFAVYLRAKGKADAELARSGLDHVIVRPVSLTDEPGTGLVQLAERVDQGTVPRDDVAAVVAALLRADGVGGLTLGLSSGDTPVDQAVASVTGGA
jgi:uncharacterized protein YbjT (DUF2867 family)